jgi:PAS domain S-box-containing protein
MNQNGFALMEAVDVSEEPGERQTQMSALFDSMPQLGWAARPDGFVYFYNQRFYEYSGCSPEELQGWGWEKLLDPQIYAKVLDRWRLSLATFQKFEMKIPLRRYDGQFCWFLTRATPIFDDHGECVRWVGVNTNIQEEIEQSNARAESERQFKLLADSLTDLVWIADSQFSCKYLNQRWVDYTQLPVKEGLGSGWRNVVHQEDLIRTDPEWKICIAAKKPFESEHRIRSADGSYRWFLVRVTPVIDERNNATSWFGTCTDLHNKKEENEHLEMLARERGERLAHAEALTESVIQSIADGIVISDPQSKLTYLNKAAQDMLEGQPAPVTLNDAVKTKRNYDYSGERLLSADELPLSQALKGRSVNDTEMTLKSANGIRRIVSVSARPIIDKSENFKGAVAVVRDITARKTAEIALQKALDEAVAANNLKSQFLANMSHEIRTPMNGILVFSQLLADDSDGLAKEWAQSILSSGKYLMKLLGDLLDLSRAEAGKIAATEEVIDLEELVNDVCSPFYSAAQEKNIKLISTVDKALPAKVSGDGNLLRQALRNLVENAIKFTERGFVHVKAQLQPSINDGDCLKFSVQDTGVGISPENQKKLFQLFVQLDGSATRKNGGTGLGLALSKRLVESMNGEITVESQEREGSTFILTFPLVTITGS